jgi:cytoskeletal protein RodZ
MSAAFFTKKTLTPTKRVCLRLREAREAKKMSLATLAEKTKIDIKYLEALEACEFEKLPTGVVYQKNYVKKYIEALGMDPKGYVAQFIDDEFDHIEPQARVHPMRHIKTIWLSSVPSYINIVIGIGIGSLLLLYIGLQIRTILQPPKLTVSSPQNGVVIDEQTVVISGETEPNITILLNGTEIKNSVQGTFNETIDLRPGLNTITITAQKKHGKTTTETRYVVRKEMGE